MTDTTPARDLPRTMLAVLFLGGLLVATFRILQPFLAPLIWATLLVIAGWPTMRRVQHLLGNRRGPAVLTMISGVLLVLMIPLGLLLLALINGAPAAAAWLHQVLEKGISPAPLWLQDVPMVGAWLSAKWTELAAAGPEGLAAQMRPQVEQLAGWFVAQAGGVTVLLVQCLLTLVLSSLLFYRGEQFANGLRRFARRLAGERGDRAAVLAASSVHAIALGVVITALVQALIGGLGLVIAGVPAAGLLTAVMLVTGIAQIGAAPIVGLSAIWLYLNGNTGWAITMLVWTVGVGSLDNVLRPILIRRGMDVPMLLVFAGVIGGLMAFGLIGLFAGPVVLAVAHTLLIAWINDGEPATPPPT